MLVCGPLSAKSQTLAAEGAVRMIAEDGALFDLDACREPIAEPAPSSA
jgi:hypothetical protein